MTDGRTDGRTDDDSIYRASIASRGNYIQKLKIGRNTFVSKLYPVRCVGGVLDPISCKCNRFVWDYHSVADSFKKITGVLWAIGCCFCVFNSICYVQPMQS